MPYEIKKRGNFWVLILESTGKVLGRHKSKESANRQRAAIEINKRKGKKV